MAKTRNVTIKATSNGGKIEFDMDENGRDTELLVFNKNNDNMKKDESYDIVFALKNQGGADLAFVQDPGDVIYISKGSDTHLPKCPKNANGNPQTPFTVSNVQPLQLTVRNPDDDICFYKFALRFIDKNNSNKIETFDPIFGNQNGGLTVQPPGGGTSFITGATTTSFFVGAVVAVLGTMLAYNVGLFA